MREIAIHGDLTHDFFPLCQHRLGKSCTKFLGFWVIWTFQRILKTELGKKMFHRMESYSLKGTWCQSYDWLKIIGLQRAVVVQSLSRIQLCNLMNCSRPDFSAEKAMAPHSSILAWKIPWTEEPGRLQSMGSLSRARLSDFTFTFHFHALEKEMATHSSILAWRIPGTEKPSGLPSLGSHRVGHDWSDLVAAAAAASFSVLHYLLEFAPTHVHWVSDAIQPPHLLTPPSPPALNLSKHQGLSQWVSS